MKPENFVQAFVIGFGFLSGLWIHVGVNPESEIAKAILSALEEFDSGIADLLGLWLLFVVPIIGAIGTMGVAYNLRGWLGVVSIALGFWGAIFFHHPIGILMVLGGIGIGMFAPPR